MRTLLAAIMTFFIFLSTAQAVSVQNGQDNIRLVVEDGKETTFFLLINSANGETLVSSSPWVTIEGGGSYTLPSGGTPVVRVKVAVPDNQAIGEYKETIKINSTVLSTVTIIVTLPTEDIRTLQTLADVQGKLNDLQDKLESRIGSLLAEDHTRLTGELEDIKTGLSGSIQSVITYQKGVRDLQTEKSVLEERIVNLSKDVKLLENREKELQSQNAELETTGNVVRGESPILFVIGILIGAGGIYLFYRRVHKYL